MRGEYVLVIYNQLIGINRRYSTICATIGATCTRIQQTDLHISDQNTHKSKQDAVFVKQLNVLSCSATKPHQDLSLPYLNKHAFLKLLKLFL